MCLRVLCAAVVLTLFAAPGPARGGAASGATAPYEDLMEVLATLTWHLRDDAYRFPAPRDPTGRDLYKLSLARLDSWEKRFPDRLRDVTTLGRAQALERLGEFRRAAVAYRNVAGMTDSPLARKGTEGASRADAFAAAAGLPESGEDVEAQLGALRRKLDAWGALVEQYKGTPYGAMALVEEERLERLTTRLVVDYRRDLQRGNETAEQALRFLIQKHADSKNLPAHVLRLGDFYADLARDYVAAHDRPLAFDEDDFLMLADRALDTYHKVATWDGAREKPEGQARFAALEAWKGETLTRYR